MPERGTFSHSGFSVDLKQLLVMLKNDSINKAGPCVFISPHLYTRLFQAGLYTGCFVLTEITKDMRLEILSVCELGFEKMELAV
jgi:hypothetical protein